MIDKYGKKKNLEKKIILKKYNKVRPHYFCFYLTLEQRRIQNIRKIQIRINRRPRKTFSGFL